MGYQAVLSALGDLVKRQDDEHATAQCPAHDDRVASLSLASGPDGKALLFCHAGCATTDVVAALGLTMANLATGRHEGETVAATYVYEDASGDPLYRVLRLEPKSFFLERWEQGEWKPGLRDVTRVLYHLPELIRLAPDATVYVVEGEKDADNLIERAGVFATTKGGATASWSSADLEMMTDRDVVVVEDNDEPGRVAAGGLRDLLLPIARSVVIAHSPIGKDVSDLLLAGKTLKYLERDDTGLSVFDPWDWASYETPDHEWLFEPYIPRAARVLAFGASGSLKSLWAAWLGAHLSAEGKKVGYFSLEMNRSSFAKRMRQLPMTNPHNFKVFGKFMMGMDLQTAIKNFEGWDLLIIDSWSQAQGELSANDNDGISRMDAEYFQPLIAATGATLLILDNTGKDTVTNDGKVKADTARGASRKQDIQEVALWFRRNDENNNFRTTISCKKMRLDIPQPLAVTVETPQDRIEFYLVDSGMMTSEPMWSGMRVDPISLENTGLDGAPSVGVDVTEHDAIENLLASGLITDRKDRGGLRLRLKELEESA